MKVQGPCFDSSSDIRCIFDGMEARGVYLSELQALCISPMLSHAGNVQFALKMDGELYGETIFTACKLVYLLVHHMGTYVHVPFTYIVSHSRGHSVDILADTLVFTDQSKVTVQWKPDIIFPQLPAMDYDVDIYVYEFNTDTEVWKEVHALSLETENDGEEEVTFPGTIRVEGSTAPISLLVCASESHSSALQQALASFEQKPGRWSAEFYYAERLVLERRSYRLCTAWYLSEPVNIGTEILDYVTSCPPTEEQASQLCNSGVVVERHISIFGNSMYDQQRREYFHPDAAICYKQPIPNNT